MTQNFYPLLALCARAQGHPLQYQQLRQQALALPAWDNLPAQAEAHGLEPLLYAHLQAAGVPLPTPLKQHLQGRVLQHRHANQVRAGVLAEILTAFQSAGVEVLVLKGAALAHLVYPEPGLRPMRDIDLLVSPALALPAQALLAELGFEAPLPPPSRPLPDKHLAVAQRRVEGVPVSLELHHNLYANGGPATALAALLPAAVPFTVAGHTAYTLGHEALLAHIYQHLRLNMLLDSLRLIWIADLVSLAERFAAEIDWPRTNPHLRQALALCHWLTPLSEELRRAAALDPGRPPQGIGQEFQGWPHYSLAAQRHKGYRGILRDSLLPPEWWLRFYYGLPSGPALAWGRWLRHPLHLAGWAGDYCLRRLNG